MARNILACYNELFAENAILFSQNTQINSVLADFVSVQYQSLARYVFPTRRRTRIISRCSTITCTLVGAIAIVHKSQLFTNATIATNANIRFIISVLPRPFPIRQNHITFSPRNTLTTTRRPKDREAGLGANRRQT